MLPTPRDGEDKPQLKIITIVKAIAETKLKEAKVEPGSTKMAAKQMPGTVGVSLGKLVTNCYQIEMKKKMPVYHYYIDIEAITNFPNARPVFLTPKAVIQSDHRLVDRRYICNGVSMAFKQRMGWEGKFFYYDLNHLAYSLKDLRLPKAGISETFTEEEVLRFIPDNDAQYAKYILTMKPIEGLITLADYSHLTNDTAHIDHTVEQFINIATSQEIFDHPLLYTNYSAALYYLLHPAEYGFLEEDCPELPGNSSFLGIGGRKGVRPIELTNGMITSGLVVELKKSPFHVDLEETVLEKLKKSIEHFDHLSTEDIIKQFEGLVKGVSVRTLHRPGKFEIQGISKETALTQMIPDRGESVNAYFAKRYAVHLENPNLPLLKCKLRDGQIVGIPMELCQVLDDQRVKGSQQVPKQVQQMIRHCAIPPSKMIKHNSNVVKPLNLAGTEYLTQAMIEANSEPIEVDARVIPQPDVRFARQNIRKPALNGTWTDAPYLIPASSSKWAAIVFYYEHDNRNDISLDVWNTFLGNYRQLMASHGMNFSEPTVERHAIPGRKEQHDRACKIVQATIEKLFKLGHEFVLIAHPDAADHVHHTMKYFEQKTEVVTQGLKIGTVINVLKEQHHQTLANIIQKTNVKMGGLNYDIISGVLQETPSLFSKDTLVIGFSMNHPGPDINPRELSDELAKEMNGIKRTSTNGHNGNNSQGNGANGNGLLTPSVVGHAANVGKKNIFEFMGDFLFQAPLRNEKTEILQSVVKRYLIQFRNANNTFPIRIVIYRDGVDQGAYENILKYEVPLLKNMMKEMDCNAKVTLMVVNKKQPLRFYRKNLDPRAKAPDQNVPPGTVIDTGVVHPKWTEFYLNSHLALHGTARTPCYTVLVNEEELGINALEVMTHHFCFGHQIVYSPTSLPTPVYVALEYAKRGRNEYNYYNYVNSNGTAPRPAVPIHDYKDLTSKLSYENLQYLRNMRINA